MGIRFCLTRRIALANVDKKVKTMNGNSWAITSSNYATSACKHMAAVKKLVAMDTTLAFNLLTFKLLDDTPLPLIEAREKPASQPGS